MGNCLASPEYMQTLSSSGNLTPAVKSQASRSTPLTNGTKSSKYHGSSSALSREEEGEHPNGQVLATPNLRKFSLQELEVATQRFNPDCLIGEGSFGEVYRGWLDSKQPSKSGSGLAVAIKKLNPESMLGFEKWQSEVNFLGTLSHPNLVKRLGYCWEDGEFLLVNEFMHRGSLVTIFLEVIYRDVKTANILLDGSYNAKLSDFRLARLGPPANRFHVTTRLNGTYVNAAPEYLAIGYLISKSDVYGFGVILVEILTGERALGPKGPSGKHNLVDWSKPFLSDRRKLKNIMDKRLEDNYPSKAAAATAELALKCLAHVPKARPSMQEVLETLEKIEAMDDNCPWHP